MDAQRNSMLIANWKMNLHWDDCENFVLQLRELLPAYFEDGGGALVTPALELAVCPAAPYIAQLSQLTQNSAIFIGAQDVSASAEGALTGQISAAMLADSGCDFCIVGHSEQRALPGCDAAQLRGKLERLRESEISPVICIGEALEVREAGSQLAFTLNQLDELHDVLAAAAGDFVLAYEPIWAIGTGRNAQPEQAQEMAAAIRGWLGGKLGEAGLRVPLLYGGSVNAENAGAFFESPYIDGALVGGASLKAESFAAIAQSAIARLP